MHGFFGMTWGSGIALSTMTVCGLFAFKMILEFVGDIIESILHQE